MLSALLLTTAATLAAPGDADVPVAGSQLQLFADVSRDGDFFGAALTPELNVDTAWVQLGVSGTFERDLLYTAEVDLDNPLDFDPSSMAVSDDWALQGPVGVSGAVEALDYLWITDPGERGALRIDRFSAVTLGRGTVLRRYNPHLSAAGEAASAPSAQAGLSLERAAAQAWVGDVLDPSAQLGAAASGRLGRLSAGGQFVRGAGPADVIGGEVGFAAVSGERLSLDTYLAEDHAQGGEGAATTLGTALSLRTGAQGGGELTAGARAASLRGGYDPTDYATLGEVFADAQAGPVAVGGEVGFSGAGGSGVEASVLWAGEASRAELLTTVQLGRRLSVAGSVISAGPTLSEEQAASARVRALPLRFVTVEAAALATPDALGWETSAGLTIPLGKGDKDRGRTVEPVAALD